MDTVDIYTDPENMFPGQYRFVQFRDLGQGWVGKLIPIQYDAERKVLTRIAHGPTHSIGNSVLNRLVKTTAEVSIREYP